MAQAQSKPKAPVKDAPVVTSLVLNDLATGQAIAKRDGKSLLVRYGDFPCLEVCSREKETCVVVHLPRGSQGDRLRVMVYYPERGKDPAGWYYHDFVKEVTKDRVEAKVAELLNLAGASRQAVPLDWTI
jgi:hypothetical protein